LLTRYADRPDTIVLALPRGGVPVADEVAQKLRAPLDVFVVRKLGVPHCEELSMGAVATGGIRYINQDIVDTLGIDSTTVDAVIAREEAELRRREELYRGERAAPNVRDKTVIVVDDGLATGSSMRAAIAALRKQDPAHIVVAVPAGEPTACKEIAREVDEAICAATPESFQAVGQWYINFSQTSDDEVRNLLSRAWGRELMGRTRAPMAVSIPIDGKDTIHAELTVFPEALGAVIFAHGSGSSRQSPRNRYVAEVLNQAGLATLLVDLLTQEETVVDNRTSEFRFDIDLLADRLIAATDWLRQHRTLTSAPLGYFGASTGAAAALVAAAERPHLIEAVVSRGGRPDLAGGLLGKVGAPTLFIVGELDEQVLELNSRAAMSMRAPTQIEIIPGATHLFEEPGALNQVAALARSWFQKMLLHEQAA
jgi:putative phosphoribosyl transferase